MKRVVLLFSFVLMMNGAFALNFTVNSITYTTTSDTTVAVKYTPYVSSISIPSNVSYQNKTYSVTSIWDEAFAIHPELIDVTLPSTIVKIGIHAFAYCPKLMNVNIPNSVIEIGNLAFLNCSSLVTIPISSTLLSIGDGAFGGSSALVIVASDNPNYSSLDGNLFNKDLSKLLFCTTSKTGVYAIPSSVNIIAFSAFLGCKQLTNVIIPLSVEEIASSAFMSCSGLSNITIPSTVKKIGDAAFVGCSALLTVDTNSFNYSSVDGNLFNKDLTKLFTCSTSKQGSYTVPSSVKVIAPYTFYLCKGLTTVGLPDSLKYLDEGTFNNCTGLTDIQLPSSLDSIASWAFKGCMNLKNIVIPDGVKKIGDQAFDNCSKLSSITIPASVSSIGYNAFYGSDSLKTIYLYTIHPLDVKIGYTLFKYDNLSTCTLYVPIGSKALYQAAPGWKDFTNIVEFDPTSVKETLKTQSNLLYNAATKGLQVSGVEGACSIEIYNCKGSLVLRRTLQGNEPFTTNALPKGMYVVRLTTGATSFIKKIAIR